MNRTQVIDRLLSEQATLQARYNRLSKGLDTPGVDVATINRLLDTIRAQREEIERQLAQLG